MPIFDFKQVDVFASEPLKGNPLAVVIAADGLADDRMAAFARWTNLSETIFLLRPTTPRADYRVRIFTPARSAGFSIGLLVANWRKPESSAPSIR